MTLTHLQHLEAGGIHIMREVVGERPFPLLHVDTTRKFREMSLPRFITCGSVDDGKATWCPCSGSVTSCSPSTRWPSSITPAPRSRPSRMGYLEAVEVDHARLERALFRMPVQWVNRPHTDFRGFAGLLMGGTVRPGDRIGEQPSGRESRAARLIAYEGDLKLAVPRQSMTPTPLADEIAVSRGDVIASAEAPAGVADRFEATIAHLKYRASVDTLEHLAAKRPDWNEIGVCYIAVDRALVFDPYRENRDTGGFILIDRLSNNTVGADLLHVAQRRSQNIRRVAEVAKLMVDAGLLVLVAFISPFRAERRMARALVGAGEFIEIFVDAPLAIPEARDPKGLYRKARRDELKNFAGIDSPYETPEHAEIRADTTATTPESATDQIVAILEERGIFDPA